MLIDQLLSYAFVGALAGISAGLLGISGGLVVIPLFIFLFPYFGLPSGLIVHAAIGTSLAAMIFNSLSSMISHNRHKGIVWDVSLWMIPGLIVGSIVGAYIAKLLPGKLLGLLFGFFECLVGAFIYYTAKHENKKAGITLGWAALMAIGFGISVISALFGIGGGIITVPVLYYLLRISLQKSIGTSAANGFFITVVAAFSYLFFGFHEGSSYPYMLGYIYLPAFFAVSIVSLFFAPLGARLAHTLPSKKLKRIFGIGLFLLGTLVLFKTFL